MPAWLITLGWKYGVPLLITILQKSGAINKAEALAGKAIIWTEENIKTYPEYPKGKNGGTDER